VFHGFYGLKGFRKPVVYLDIHGGWDLCFPKLKKKGNKIDGLVH
jgi:hypothetical protein